MEEDILKQQHFQREKEFARLYKENETYAKLELKDGQILFVKGIWYPTHFLLAIMDGQDTWDINGIENISYCKVF